MTYLIVGEESSFFSVLSSLASSTGGGVDPEVAGVAEGEGSAVGCHADDQLVLGSSQSHPQICSVVHAQLFAPLRVA